MRTEVKPQLLSASKSIPLKGSTEPRIWTPALRELTEETTTGFAVSEFARNILERPLTPWQDFFAVHSGEMYEDGRPRFRRVLGLVARQNGKTELLKILSAFWLICDYHIVQQILGISTNRESAFGPWKQTLDLIQDTKILSPLISEIKKSNAKTSFETVYGSNYIIRAANRRAARGLTIDRVIFDELREQTNFEAWDAVIPTIRARPYGQAIAISNAGDDGSKVLNKVRQEALDLIESGIYDTGIDESRLGLFEWSAAPGDDITSPATWAKANPNMGYIFSEDEIRSDALSAISMGGEVLAGFKTESLCIRVSAMDAAVDPEKWSDCFDDSVSLANLDKSKLHYFFDVSLTQTHATLMAAGEVDGKVRLELVHEWRDTAMRNLVPDLKRLITKHSIKNLGYFPVGPAATYATRLKAMGIRTCNLMEVTSEVSESCMGFADEVFSKTISHQSNELTDQILTQQVIATAKKWTADRWKFTRQNVGNCDAAYAAAGALLLARSEQPQPEFQLYAIKPKGRS